MDLYNASNPQDEDEPIALTLEEYTEMKANLQVIIDRAEMARRLSENTDFQGLVLDGYFRDEPNRLANLMASGKLPEQSMVNCTKDLDAIGRFRNFMKLHMDQGKIATEELASLEEARQEAIEAEEAALAGE